MHQTQLERYKKLVSYIDDHFKEDIDIAKVEEICHYSYRNINRIFLALHQETIGKYIKRRRLEKAAEYLRYSPLKVSTIAYEVGFNDVAAFSKAFKQRFSISPKSFRTNGEALPFSQPISFEYDSLSSAIDYSIELLPEFEVLFLEYRGDYQNLQEITQIWAQLQQYAQQHGLEHADSIWFAEILDDHEISEALKCRYRAALVLDNQTDFQPSGLYQRGTRGRQKYAKFIHQGSHEDSMTTYQNIYTNWLANIPLAMADGPILEFYLNDDRDTPAEQLITEIYVPID